MTLREWAVDYCVSRGMWPDRAGAVESLRDRLASAEAALAAIDDHIAARPEDPDPADQNGG